MNDKKFLRIASPRCLRCAAPAPAVTLCQQCCDEIFETPQEIERLFACAMVACDGGKWLAFTVSGGGPFRFRQLKLVAKCESENQAEIAARMAIGDPGIESEDVAASLGGFGSAASMSPEQRRERARKASAARWDKERRHNRGFCPFYSGKRKAV